MSRKVRVAVVSILSDEESRSTPGLTVKRTLEAAEEAGSKWNADIVVLPELPDVAEFPASIWLTIAGEEIPSNGPIQSMFAEIARKYNMYICLDILELENGRKYNTAVLLGRNGEYVGKYRKTHLCPSEDQRVDPGSGYPIFDTDFGKVAISICMDIHSPELYRIYALEGAELILHPTMAYDYTGNHLEPIENARAIDNGVYFAMSRYIKMPFLSGQWMGHARIIDPAGRTRADTGHIPNVACAEIDLDINYEVWYKGELKREYPTLKAAYMKIRRPETYGVLTRPDSENKWNLNAPDLIDPCTED